MRRGGGFKRTCGTPVMGWTETGTNTCVKARDNLSSGHGAVMAFLNMQPPSDIPGPPAATRHKYRIDLRDRIVRADFSKSGAR